MVYLFEMEERLRAEIRQREAEVGATGDSVIQYEAEVEEAGAVGGQG